MNNNAFQMVWRNQIVVEKIGFGNIGGQWIGTGKKARESRAEKNRIGGKINQRYLDNVEDKTLVELNINRSLKTIPESKVRSQVLSEH